MLNPRNRTDRERGSGPVGHREIHRTVSRSAQIPWSRVDPKNRVEMVSGMEVHEDPINNGITMTGLTRVLILGPLNELMRVKELIQNGLLRELPSNKVRGTLRGGRRGSRLITLNAGSLRLNAKSI